MTKQYGKRTVHGFVDSSPAGEPGGLAVDNEKTVTHRAALAAVPSATYMAARAAREAGGLGITSELTLMTTTA